MRPSARVLPAVGLMIPATMRSSVVLPEPLRPMSPTASPGSTRSGHVVERPDVARLRPPALDEEVLQRARLTSVNTEAPRDAVDRDLARLHAT